jgi:hypothetical protein
MWVQFLKMTFVCFFVYLMSNILLSVQYYFVSFGGMLVNTLINKIWTQIDNYQHQNYMLQLTSITQIQNMIKWSKHIVLQTNHFYTIYG